jgi:hypothetical protein
MDHTENTVLLLLFNCCLEDRTENTIPLLLFAGHYLAIAAVCFTDIAWQRVYMPQYN